MTPTVEIHDDRDHHDGDGDEEESYAIGVCVLRIETAGTKIDIEAPDTIAMQEIASMAIEMTKNLQTGVQ